MSSLRVESTGETTHVHVLESLYFPELGGWRASVILDSGTTLPAHGARVTLTVGDFPIVGHVDRASFDAPSRPHVIVVGGLGWLALVNAPISFQSDAGVRLSTVLSAIATAAGMTIVQPTDVTIGDYYEIVASRPGEPVRWKDVLDDLVRGGYAPPWRFDSDGVTRFGARAGVEVSSRATVIKRDASDGSVLYGLDAPAQFLPGNTIDGSKIGRVRIRETTGKLEAEIWPATESTASIRDQVHRLVALAFGDFIRTYTVAGSNPDGTIDLSPPSDAPHLPEMRNVKQWTIGGIQFIPPNGAQCVVAFRDVKKTRPIILGFELESGAPFPPVARVGDTVQVFMPASMPITGIITPPGSSFTGVLTVPAPSLGTIQTGSTKTGGKS